MPLAVGNSWSYDELPAAGFTGDTNNYTLSIIKDTVMTLTIDSVIDIGRWYRVTGFPGMPPTYYANRGNGFWQTFIHVDILGNVLVTDLIAKFPATIGDTYSRIFPPPLQTGSTDAEVMATDSTITVPAGTFKCYVYRVTLSSDSRLSFDAFYAPGIGSVKINYYDLAPANNSITRVTKLGSYNIK